MPSLTLIKVKAQVGSTSGDSSREAHRDGGQSLTLRQPLNPTLTLKIIDKKSEPTPSVIMRESFSKISLLYKGVGKRMPSKCVTISLSLNGGSGESHTGKGKASPKITNSTKTGGVRDHPNKSIRDERKLIQTILKKLRERHTIGEAKTQFLLASHNPAYVAYENATGGCLDSIALGLCGFRHAGGTEDINSPTGLLKARLFQDLTGAKCWGCQRTWRIWSKVMRKLHPRIHYYKSGMPCINHASLGDQLGSEGNKGGDLFPGQCDQILEMEPDTFRLEIVGNALKVPKDDPGKDVRIIRQKLGSKYRLFQRLIEVWRLGDPSNRQRYFLVGLKKSTIPSDIDFEWPEDIFGEEHYPIARDIASPDEEIPPEYWRHDKVDLLPHRPPRPGNIHKVGEKNHTGVDTKRFRSGLSNNPTRVDGWDGLWHTAMTTNGGAVHPSLNWRSGQPITKTRLTVIIEWLKAASLDELSYLEWVTRFHNENVSDQHRDQWVRECVNMGVPMCTSVAIDKSIWKVLGKAGIKPADPDPYCKGEPLLYGLEAFVAQGDETTTCMMEEAFSHNDPSDHHIALLCNEEDYKAITGIADTGCTNL